MWSAVLVVGVAAAAAPADPWAEVRQTLATWPNMSNFAFSAGDLRGRRFVYERGNTTMQTSLYVASASKFPAALAIGGVVDDGYLSLDTAVHQIFPWWTTDDSDPRSRVTLRQLLGFTSGFYSADAGGNAPCLSDPNTSAEDCAKQVYDTAPFIAEPGTSFDYNSYHLQVAGAMAAKAANATVPGMLEKYVLSKFMPGSAWVGGGENPALAASLRTNGDDYDGLLRGYLKFDVVSKELASEFEEPFGTDVAVSNASTFLVDNIGRYSLCNWYECLANNGTFEPACAEARLHMDAGLYGYYPLVNRRNQTYFQIVVYEYAANLTDFRPTTDAIQLRLAIKPLVDAALAADADEAAPSGLFV